MTTLTVSAEAVRRFRFRRHQLDRDPVEGGKGGDVALLDFGVQDTGPDGARTSGQRLRLAVEPWTRLTKPVRTALEEQAERLAAHRGVTLAGIADG